MEEKKSIAIQVIDSLIWYAQLQLQYSVAFVFGVEITSTVAAIDPKLYFHCGKYDDFFYTIIRK